MYLYNYAASLWSKRENNPETSLVNEVRNQDFGIVDLRWETNMSILYVDVLVLFLK